MNLAAFYADVQASLRRGNSTADLIPGWAEDAALWLEQNYSFAYMKRTLSVVLDPLAADANLIDIEDRLKAVRFIRRVYVSGSMSSYGYLEKVEPGEISSIDLGAPSYYWLEGMNNIWLDSKVQELLTVEVGGIVYTDWPLDETATPTLLRYYKNLLKAQTLIEAAIDLKDDRMLAAYESKFQRAIAAVLVAEEESARLDTDAQMRPGPILRG
jgi:hypothetical protein